MYIASIFCVSLFCAPIFAERIPENHILYGPGGKPSTLVKRQTATSRPVPSSTATHTNLNCSNGPTSRSCWSDDFDISTDFDEKWPKTGKVRAYNWEVTNTPCSPDGNSRVCSLINGQYPGPTVFADWGDTIQVTLKNSLPTNGTGLHFHGVRQLNTNSQDGVPGVTECPLAPGDSKTYTFQATQYGTSWYHSHWSAQYADGVVGPIVVNGPATANYDIDLGAYPVSDWFSRFTAWQFLYNANVTLQEGLAPPPGDTIVINGTNVNSSGGGKYNQVTLTPGKTHRLRIINTSSELSLRVTLDGHTFTVISNDWVPIQPFETNQLLLTVGQRYDVIVTANQTAGNYWFRADAANECQEFVNSNAKAIFTYDGTPVATPNTTGVQYDTGCLEPDASLLVPYWPTTIPSSNFLSEVSDMPVNVTIPGLNTNGQSIVAWVIDTTAIKVDWEDPSLKYIADNNTNYPSTYNVLSLPNENIWTYWIIHEAAGNPVQVPHPMHLHGHDFWILGRGNGTFNSANVTGLNFVNPPRRDVTLLPGSGWVAVAFPTDNPGAWLMHCHVSTHISAGLGVQFLEAVDQLPQPTDDWDQTCSNWKGYYQTAMYDEDDSGL
ncbi:putative multicopper oxidase, type 1 [Microthyrium microscopicum]|uniref:laccase n=1 Tax=Microthyrium microscopicum TaxID=703497 RepID=A0A6A6TYT8_9PEZI|nr:putative multicopper oxidase, type 1 [Microthyrium microscopicum]